MKICKTCNIAKEETEFYKDRKSLKVECKLCQCVSMQAKEHNVSREEYIHRRTQPCEICGIYKLEPEKRGSGMHIDHDHITGALRGTLCDRCNRGLGMFDDEPAKLQQAIEYIKKYRPAVILSRTEALLVN